MFHGKWRFQFALDFGGSVHHGRGDVAQNFSDIPLHLQRDMADSGSDLVALASISASHANENTVLRHSSLRHCQMCARRAGQTILSIQRGINRPLAR